jgi:hypothetical protein
MGEWQEGGPEIDEITDEYIEDEPEKEIVEEANQEIEDIPDVWYADHIKDIKNPELREKEIEAAEELKEKERALDKELESGEIDKVDYWGKRFIGLGHEERKAATRCSLESADITYDHFGDSMEDLYLLATEASGDPKPARMKDKLKESIRRIGPEASQELADRMLEEGKMSKETHESISRQVRLHGK